VYIYDENGNVTGIHDQNQTDVVKVYDDASRIYGVTNKNSNNTTLSSYTYTLNDDNLITEIDEIGGDTQTFDYDAMHHLISATRTGTGSYSETYEVDGNGNRTSKTVGDDTYTYDYSDDDEILHEYLGETTTHTWTYDDNGNQLTRTVDATSYTLAYDAENQLTTISTGGSPVKSYTYDGIGRRESRAAGGTTTHFWYDGTELVNERVGSSWTANSVYGLGLLKRSDQYPLYDDQGSSRKVTNDGESAT
jgi:YD repeat-containing protein